MSLSPVLHRLHLSVLSAALLALGAQGVAAQAPTQTRLALSSETSVIGQAVTLTATLATGQAPPPAGQLQFRDGDQVIGTADLEAIGIEAAQIAAGRLHSCALTTAGQVHCWGRGAIGSLTETASPTPLPVREITDAVSVAAGWAHSCAALASGEVLCWGDNAQGQLGDGTTTGSRVPVAVSGITNAVSVTAGTEHSCALLADGAARCWGRGGYGRLGDGSTAPRQLVPVAVSGITDAVSVSAGHHHSCAVLASGEAQCWGRNLVGELGNGTTTLSRIPVPVSEVTDAVDISAGRNHSCAALATGQVRCWGSGPLGDGVGLNSQTPVEVSGITDAVAVSAGRFHSCAVLSSGGLRCWGRNDTGQLGDGTTTNRPVPVDVAGIGNAVAVAAGTTDYQDDEADDQSHSCAILSSGEVRCWGSNAEGKLGDGTADQRLTPVAVTGLRLDSGSRARFETSTLPAGLRALTAAFAGIEDHAPSTSATQFHLVHSVSDQALQTITFAHVPGRAFVRDEAVPLQASSSSGLPVVFTSLTPDTCSTAGATATMLAGGLCRIEATAAGTEDFLPAVPQRRAFAISPGAQTISFAPIPDQGLMPDATVALEASASSGLPVAFSSQTPDRCTVSGATAALVALGTCTIAASQPGDDSHMPAPEVTRSFAILPGTTIALAGPETGLLGESLTFTATLASDAGTPGGQVTFRYGDTTLGSAALDAEGVARLSTTLLPLGAHDVTAHYARSGDFAPAVSEPLRVTVRVLNAVFVGGGAVFSQTEACAAVLGNQAHAVTVRYSPSELGGLPSGVSIAWREGSEHLARWGAMGPDTAFLGGAGRSTWTRFVFYPTRPLVRVVDRRITDPAGATQIDLARELVLRLRVQHFAATPGCSVTVAATLQRTD